MLLILILMVGSLLIGYRWGRQEGQLEGYKKGMADLPLVLREQSLEQGYCLLCANADRQSSPIMETIDDGFYG